LVHFQSNKRKMAAVEQDPNVIIDYKLASRVASYSVVSKVFDTGKDYYNWGREASPIVAFAESSIEGGLTWLTPKVEPLLETAKPYLVKADNLGCSALDTVENTAQKIHSKYEATTSVIGGGMTTVKDVTCGTLAQVQEKVVVPVDEYLKDSVVAKPINLALDVTERVVNHYLNDGKGDKLARGPISKTSYLSKRIQQQAYAKLHHLSLRAPEKINAMEYTVNLIDYASHALDSGINSVNQTVSNGIHTGTTFIKEVPKEVKEKVQSATHDALAAVHTAANVISNHIPEEISIKFQQLKQAAYHTGDTELKLFSSVAQSSSKLLREISTTIGGYVAQGEAIPFQILSKTYENLHSVIDSLINYLEYVSPFRAISDSN